MSFILTILDNFMYFSKILLLKITWYLHCISILTVCLKVRGTFSALIGNLSMSPSFCWLDRNHAIMALYIDTFNHKCLAWLYSIKHITLCQTFRNLLLSTSPYWLEGYHDIMILSIDTFNHKCIARLCIVKSIWH